jgi:hypothetical protein
MRRKDATLRATRPDPLGDLWTGSSLRKRMLARNDNPNHFLNKFSNAWRASLGRRVAGVEVSFSLVTRIS